MIVSIGYQLTKEARCTGQTKLTQKARDASKQGHPTIKVQTRHQKEESCGTSCRPIRVHRNGQWTCRSTTANERHPRSLVGGWCHNVPFTLLWMRFGIYQIVPRLIPTRYILQSDWIIRVIRSDHCCIDVIFIALFDFGDQLRYCHNLVLLAVRGFLMEKKRMGKEGTKNDP
eukprot:scaffold70086_cov49-Attheya_sp.AAC.1